MVYHYYGNSASTMLVLRFCDTTLQMTLKEHWTVCRQLSDYETHHHCW